MRRIAALTLILSAFTATGSASAAPAAAPAVIAGGQLDAPAVGLVAGLDGSLWHTSAGKTARVGRTTLAGRTVELPLPDEDARPGAIAIGPDLAMWIADEKGAILRVSPAGTIATVRELDGSPRSLALARDGNLWLTQADLAGKNDNAIGRLTAQGALTLFDDGLTGRPADITAGPDDAVWFTEPDADLVGRAGLDGTITEFAVGDLPSSVALGADGALWITLRKAIGRLQPDGTYTEYADGLPSSWQPSDIAVGPDGALWFTTKRGLGHITLAGAITNYPTPRLSPGAIALGGDGAMWFTDLQLPVLGRIGSLSTLAGSLAAPTLGKTFVASVTSGDVAVRRPGKKGFQPLATRATLPVGTVVDATDGAVKLRSALGRRKGTQTGTFFGGRFQVRQPRKRNGLVRIKLRGRLDCRADPSSATASRKRRRRRIWGVDLGGLFQTLGLDSITTVRGTRWLTEDRCGGTLTRVVHGSVVVRERATGKRVVVRAGERYLARRR